MRVTENNGDNTVVKIGASSIRFIGTRDPLSEPVNRDEELSTA
jgi:hypothetical protein